MATFYKAPTVKPAFAACAAERANQPVVVPFSYTVSTALVVNDVIGLVKLPPHYVLKDSLVVFPDLDTNGTPTIITDLGVYLDDSVDGSIPTVVDQDALNAASTLGQTGGMERMDESAGVLLAPTDTDRLVCLKVTTAPATGATGVTIKGWVEYRPQQAGY